MTSFSSVTRINREDMAKIANSFPAMCYPSENMEIQCRKAFLKGIKEYQNGLIEILKDYFNKKNPCDSNEKLEIKIEDKSLWEFYNALLIHSKINDIPCQ